MAVLLDCDSGSFISHNKLVESWYRKCRRSAKGDVISIKLKDALFDVRTPMRMDSAAEKLVAGTRRRKFNWIAEASERIVRAALDAGHLEPGLASDEEVLENNRTARAAAADALAAASGLDACPSLPVGCSAPHARHVFFL
ncbi:hypothetical protein MRX96_041495 [Rhipicephalus microplus]